MMPIIIIVRYCNRIVTATEAGVIAIGDGLSSGFWISKNLRLKDMPEILISSGHTTAIVMITIAAAAALSNVLVRMRFQNEVMSFVVTTIGNPISGTLF
jgi:C4-dicarboxylate transporter DctM subunit